MPIVPFPVLSVYRNLPSALTVMSRLVAPDRLLPTTVPASGVSVPSPAIAKPEIVEDPAFDTYTNLPSGVIAFQQFAAPNVGTLALIAVSVPLASTAYEVMAEPFATPAAPVSETIAAPLGAKTTENAPGPALAFTTIGDNVPSGCTKNTSTLLVSRSVTARKCPFGLIAMDAAPEVFVERNPIAPGICSSRLPCR